ncbi:uncharacterized protein LOC135496755 [Lineus longissimus]|uniref:uncharacterized protein LOC135496755 n=1 Tax=Lineus longissimus TaxID=88925 RepID=UPI002B4CA67C
MVFTQNMQPAWSDHDLLQFQYTKALEKLCQTPTDSTCPSPPSSSRSPIDDVMLAQGYPMQPYYLPTSPQIDTQQVVYAQLVQTPYGVEYVPVVMSPTTQQLPSPDLLNPPPNMLAQVPQSVYPAPNLSTLPQGFNTVTTPSLSTITTSSLSTGSGSGSEDTSDDEGAAVSVTQMMEIVWHGHFRQLFAQFAAHSWTLAPTFTQPTGKWRTFQDSAKVRFVCSECAKGWTSMKGRVVFWYYLDLTTGQGNVMFKLYGQQCKTCKSGKYEHAMWYPEEVVKVIQNIYSRVGQVYYAFEKPALRKERRNGKPATMHDKELCQACEQGVCREK